MTNPDWSQKSLGELFDIGAGKTMSAAAREHPDRIPFLRTANVLWDKIDLTNLDAMHLTERELRDKGLEYGDLLVCEGGEIGRAAVWTGGPNRISFQNHLHRLRRINPEVEPRFYVYFLQSAFTQLGIFEGAGNKTTIANLSKNRLLALDVPHPSLHEQQQVVQCLSAIREAIELHDRAANSAFNLKQAFARELFTCGLKGDAQQETEIGPIPASWQLVEFSDVRQSLRYGTSKSCSPTPKKYPVLRIPNVEPGRVDASELKYCDLSETEAARYLLEDGDLIFIRTNGVLERLGACAVYSGEPQRCLFASYLIRARLDQTKVLPRYVAYFYESSRGTNIVTGRATPAADGKYNLNSGAIDSLVLPLPPTTNEQQQVVDMLASIDAKIDLHQRKRAVLEDLFKSLLHKLMTGEVRVAHLDLSALGPEAVS